MPTLTPIEDDPFAQPQRRGLTPVDHDPFAPSAPAPTAPSVQPQTAAGQPPVTSYLPSWAPNFSNQMADAATFGGTDLLHAALSKATNALGLTSNAPDLATLRARSAEREKALGKAGTLAADALGYGFGGGALGMGEDIAGALAPAGSGLLRRVGANMAGSGAESAAAGTLGTVGHTVDPSTGGIDVDQAAKAALYGGAFGAAAGIPGGFGRGKQTLAPAKSATDIEAEKKAAYAPLSQTLFMANEIGPRLNAVDTAIAAVDLTGKQRQLAKSTMAEADNLKYSPQLTADDIRRAQKRLMGYKSTDEDRWMAPEYAKALEDVLQNGISPNAPTGFAAAQRDLANKYAGRLKDTNRLAGWEYDAKHGKDVGAQARDWLLSDKGKTFTPQIDKAGNPNPAYDALNTLAKTAKGPLANAGSGLTIWDLKHHLAWPMATLAGAEGLRTLYGDQQPWWARLSEDVLGLGVGLGVKKGVSAYGNVVQKRAIDAARTALSTGQRQAPLPLPAPVRGMIRRGVYGAGAGGQF